MTWFQIWTVCWQVAVFLTPMLLGCAVLWLKSQFVTKADATTERNRIDARLNSDKVERDQRYEAIRSTQFDHETRLRMVEVDVAKPPSRHTLNNAVSTLQGAVHSLGRSIDDLRHLVETHNNDTRREISTLNSYVHTVIEKHIQ